MGLGAGDDDAIKPAIPEIVKIEVETAQMPLSALGSRNSGQGVKLHHDWDAARGDIEQLEELEFGVLERRVGHIFDERKSDALAVPDVTADRTRSLIRPTSRNSPTFNDQRHIAPPRPKCSVSRDFTVLPLPRPGTDPQECRQCARCPR